MSYLFGDSTPSSLPINYVEFLRDVIEFAALVESAGAQLEAGRERLVAHKQATDVEVARLEALDGVVSRALAGAATGAADSPTAHCAATIARTVTGVVRSEIQAVAGKLSDDIAKINGEAAREREGCQRALEVLLKRHDLPDTQMALTLALVEEAPYVARLRGTTTMGLVVTLDLDVPAAHLFGRPLRLERVAEKLEVEAPESSGWLQKTMKMRPQRLDRFYLSRVATDASGSRMELRASTKSVSEGFDVVFGASATGAQLVRIGEDGAAQGEPFDLAEADVSKLNALRDKLVTAATELTTTRKGLASAELDGKPFLNHATPTVLVERIIEAIAPTVQEISRHSLSPHELVLKRLVSGDRREEIFVSKAELAQKLDKLADVRRAVFDPLGLWEIRADGRPARPSPPPPPSPPARPATPAAVVAAPSLADDSVAERSEPAIPIDDHQLVIVALDAGAEEDAPSAAPGGDTPPR